MNKAGEGVSNDLDRILGNEGKDPNKVEEEIDIKESVDAGDSTKEIPKSESLEKKGEDLRGEIQEVQEERKKNRILSFIKGTSEKLDQEKEDLSRDKGEVFKELTEDVKEKLKKAGHYLKDLIKDYRYTEISAGISASGVVALLNEYGFSGDTAPMTLTAAIALSMYMGGLVSTFAALDHEHKKRK